MERLRVRTRSCVTGTFCFISRDVSSRRLASKCSEWPSAGKFTSGPVRRWPWALVGLTIFLPMVLMTLPAGHVADTRERKKVIVAMQAVLAVTSLGLPSFRGGKLRLCGFIFVCLWPASRELFCGRPALPFSRNWSREANFPSP